MSLIYRNILLIQCINKAQDEEKNDIFFQKIESESLQIDYLRLLKS